MSGLLRGTALRSHRFDADTIAELAEAGIGEVRLVIDWQRVEPSNGRRDREALEALRHDVEVLRDGGLAIWACLVDDDLPGWFAHDERGFGDDRSRNYLWPRHVEVIGELIGDVVAGWVPVHEPNRWAHRGWITGAVPPHRHEDSRGFAAALEGIQRAAVDAAIRLRGSGRPTMSSNQVIPLFPSRPEPDAPASAEAEAMTSVLDEALFGSWRRLIQEGTLTVGHRPPVSVPEARGAFDVLGFSYRGGAAVRADGALLPHPSVPEPGPDGQVEWAHGFGLALHHVAETFPDATIAVTGYGLRGVPPERSDAFDAAVLDIAGEGREGGIELRSLWRHGSAHPAER